MERDLNLSKYCLTNKVKEGIYKVIQLIYAVRLVIAEVFRGSETTCFFCNLKKESLKHAFYECVSTQMFWIEIECIRFQFTKLKSWLSGIDIVLLYKNKSLEQNLLII